MKTKVFIFISTLVISILVIKSPVVLQTAYFKTTLSDLMKIIEDTWDEQGIEWYDPDTGRHSDNWVEPEEHHHSWEIKEEVKATCTSEGHVTYICSCGETKEKMQPVKKHDYEPTVIRQGSCIETELISYTCLMCGDTYEEEGELKEHTKGEWEVDTAPQLFSEGKDVIKCSVCGEVLEERVTEQLMPVSFKMFIGIIAGAITLIGALVTLIILKFKKA